MTAEASPSLDLASSSRVGIGQPAGSTGVSGSVTSWGDPFARNLGKNRVPAAVTSIYFEQLVLESAMSPAVGAGPGGKSGPNVSASSAPRSQPRRRRGREEAEGEGSKGQIGGEWR